MVSFKKRLSLHYFFGSFIWFLFLYQMANSSVSKIQDGTAEIMDSTSVLRAIAPVQSSQDIELVSFDEIISEQVNVRSKLRLIAIMVGLNVRLFFSFTRPLN